MKNCIHRHMHTKLCSSEHLIMGKEKRNVNTNMSVSKRFNGKSGCLFKAYNNTTLLLRLCLNAIIYIHFPTCTFVTSTA